MPQRSKDFIGAEDMFSSSRFASAKKTAGESKKTIIPRVHPPGMAMTGHDLVAWDGFSLGDTYNADYTDNPESQISSSSSAGNTTYRTTGTHVQPDFRLFDDLERRTRLPGGNIPRRQSANMLGTLNSLPVDPSGANNTFSDVRDLDEIELVTDMLDDMTKGDDFDDDFTEAFNPYFSVPRATTAERSQTGPPGWFSMRDDDMNSTIDC